MSDPGGYPARLHFDGPVEIENWRPLVHWLLAIPHFVVSWALKIVQQVLQLVAFFTVLFTKKVPRELFDIIVMTMRYRWRVDTYVLWMRTSYPRFDLTPSSGDPGDDPASISVDYPAELNRWLPLVKWLLAVPHYLLLVVLYVGAVFVALGAFFAVLFTGRYPEGMRSYLIGVNRWSLRVLAYAGFLRDEYPPFSLE